MSRSYLQLPLIVLAALGLHSTLSAEAHQTLFSSESVCAGHPDKMCDQISDAILDEILRQDPKAKTGIETVVGDDCIALYGEVNTTAIVDFEAIVRKTIQQIGYTNPAWGFSDRSPFQNHLHQQSPDIAIGVKDDEGAGDQGMMFGYACTDTQELMPMPITLSHALTRRLDQVRKEGIVPFIRPDGKSQVTVAYENGKPVRVEKVVIAISHSENVDHATLSRLIIKRVITPVLDAYGMKVPPTKDIIINGTGIWHIPGPQSDAGLTGRKIVVDTYGGYARVGGGAFSGKDPSKVDRSGAYAARYIAKNIVAAGFAERCEVGLAYVIGQPRPVMVQIETFGTAKSQMVVEAFAASLIDTSVKKIIETLDLRRPIYKATAAYGHFGREGFPWETVQTELIENWKRENAELLEAEELQQN
ncbi:MAG: methionine adenosyltransferase [Verrucomicrobia bacterium]|nr:methionine adenosyltransferase [Verrucomicrobiota bacterium]